MKKSLYLLILFIILFMTGCGQKTGLDSNTQALPPVNADMVNANNEQIKDIVGDWLYFAYGSNMNSERMKDRCGADNFTDLGKANLAGYDFYFYGKGHANIKLYASKMIEGVLWNINEECLKKLDQVEGYPNVYQRQAVKVNWQNKNILAQVYIVEKDNTTSKPSFEYLQTVLTGAQEHHLSESYIQKIKDLAE